MSINRTARAGTHSYLPLLLGASIISVASALGAPASAQSALLVSTDAAASASSAATADADGVGEVVVVARRREEKQEDVPIAITTISGQSIQRDNTDLITKLGQKIPSITTYWSNPKQVLISLRGLGANAGNNDGLEPSVGMFIDGVYLSRTGQIGFSGNFEDVSSVQVLRGPQGTLFGKNTTAGAILISSNAPTFHQEASAEVNLGNYNLRQFRAMYSGPVVDDKLAIRVSGYDNRRDGLFENLTTGTDLDTLNNWGGRVQLLYTPTSNLSVRLIGQHDEIAQSQQPSAFLGDGPVRTGSEGYSDRITALGFTPVVDPFSYKVYQDARLFSTARQTGLTGEIDWSFGGGYKLTSITGYRDYHFVPNNDFDYTPLLIEYDGGTTNNLHQYSQEIRIASPSGQRILGQSVDWVIGAFGFRQTLRGVNSALWGPLQYYIAKPPAGTTPEDFDGIQYGYDAVGRIRSYALFGQATWHITPRLELTGGVRPTWEHKSARTHQYLTNPGGLTPTQVASVFSVTFGDSGGSVSSYNTSWLGSLAYKVTPDILIYTSVSRGYKSAAANIGVFSPAQIRAGAQTIVPGEKTTSYEAGFKGVLFDRQLQFNLAIFDSEVRNYQTTIQAVDDSVAVNPSGVKFLAAIPSVRTRGVEIEASIAPKFAPGLNLDGSASYTDATYRDFTNAPCPIEIAANYPSSQVCFFDLSGYRLEQIPKWSVNAGGEYSRPITENVTAYGIAQWSWRSDNYLAASDSAYGHIGSYSLANFRVGLRWDERYDLSLWVNNAFQEHYLVNAISATVGGAVRGSPGDPRTFGASFKVKL